MILCADIGNSGIRIGAWQDGQPNPVLLWRKGLKTPLDALRTLPELDIPDGHSIRWGIVSVNTPLLNQLTGWLQEFRPSDSLKILDRSHVPMSVDLDNPDSVGMDRLVSSWAAWNKTPDRPAIVVDAGSAVTVDLTMPSGRFLGGNIFPGTLACLRALAENTDQLPQLGEGAVPATPFGRSTSEAIRSGVYRMQAAGIVSLVRQLQEFASADDRQVHLTGGGMPVLLPLLPDWQYTGHLIVDGIRDLVTR